MNYCPDCGEESKIKIGNRIYCPTCCQTFKILHLTLKKKWFDLIKSGKKKSEYREIKPYWTKRFFEYDKVLALGNTSPYGVPAYKKSFDYIIFTNGYSKDAPKIVVEWKDLIMGEFEGKYCYEIKLGKVYGN